jgi:hypothetical protein
MKKQDHLEIDGMGFFLWCLRVLWRKATRKRWIKRITLLLRMWAAAGGEVGILVDRIQGFMFCYDGKKDNAYQKKFVPWKWLKLKRKYDLTQPRKKYWKVLRIMYEILADEGWIPVPCYFMDRYNQFQFQQSIQSCDLWDEAADPYQVEFINRDLDLRREIFPDGPWPCCMVNEPGHRNHEHLKRIGDKHRDLYEKSHLFVYTPVTELYFDNLGSEGVYWWFVGYFDWKGEQAGSEEYLINGRRAIAVSTHSVALRCDVIEEVNNLKGSAWKPPSRQLWGCDGGTKEKERALGPKLYTPTGRLIWAAGDGPQTYELVHYICEKGKKYRRNWGWQIAFFSVLKGWPLKEKFWPFPEDELERLKAAARAVADVYGGES